MIELFIERWTGSQGGTEYRRSVWNDGLGVQMGPHTYSDSDECEAEGLDFCVRSLGHQPVKVTKL